MPHAPLPFIKNMSCINQGWGVLNTKEPCKNVPPNGYKINLLVYEWPLIKYEIWYMNGSTFQKFVSNLRNFWKNWMILLKIWLKIRSHGIWKGHFFLKNLYVYGFTYIICDVSKLEYPPLIKHIFYSILNPTETKSLHWNMYPILILMLFIILPKLRPEDYKNTKNHQKINLPQVVF